MSVAGRVMARRGHGKVTFLIFRICPGIQVYASRIQLAKNKMSWFKLDIGDIVGVKGTVFAHAAVRFHQPGRVYVIEQVAQASA